MKPFVKICLIVCGVLALLGFTGIGISLAMGLRPAQLLDLAHYPGDFAEYKLLQDIPDELPDIPDKSDDLPATSHMSDSRPVTHHEFDYVPEISMDLGLCDLTIKTHSKDVISLDVQNAGSSFTFSQSGDRLTLKDDRKTKGFNFLKEALFLTVYLPPQALEKLDIKLGVGDLYTGDLAVNDLDAEVGVGDLILDSLACDTLSLVSGVGDLSVKKLAVSSEAFLESGAGDITVDSYDGPKLDLESGAGDVYVTACGRESDYSYDLDCDLGDLYYPLPAETHHSEHHEKDDSEHHLSVEHSTGRTMNLHCGVGDLTLHFTEED